MRRDNRLTRQAGFNLIEAAIVLGIVGLVVGGVWAAASAAYENMRLQSASKNLLAMASNIKNYYNPLGVTTIDTNAANLIRMGIVPKDMISGSAIKSPWGENVVISTDAADRAFGISFQNLPASSCNALIARNFASTGGVITNMSTAAGTGVGDDDATVTNVSTANCGVTTRTVRFNFKIK